MGTGPVQVQAVCEAVLGELAGAFPTTQVTGSLAQWAGVLGSLQQVIDTASAVQDAVIARLAAIEPVVLEDGTIAETHRALGHAALDTPAIVSGVLNVAPVHAESRVRAALALAADGPAGTATATGLGGLHAAMATGALDTYRAGGHRRRAGRGTPGGRRHRRGRPGGALRVRGRRAPAPALPAGADPDQPRPAGPTRPPRPPGVRAAPLGRRTRRRQVGGHLPLRRRRPGLGRDRRPGPPVPQPRCLPDHRTRPRQSPDRPGRRQRHHRHHPDRHRPRHRPARHGPDPDWWPPRRCPRRRQPR